MIQQVIVYILLGVAVTYLGFKFIKPKKKKDEKCDKCD